MGKKEMKNESQEFKFTIFERITMLNILGESFTGSFLILKQIREFRERLSFSENEMKRFAIRIGGEKYLSDDGVELVVPEGQIIWRETGEEFYFTLSESVIRFIRNIFEELDRKELLKEMHIGLYEKFMIE